jgi:hypothetical protein
MTKAIDPVENHILRTNIASKAGTSGQAGAGQPTLARTPLNDQATLGDDEGLVANDAISESEVADNGYFESTDENELGADFDAVESNTHRPDQNEFFPAQEAVSITPRGDESLDTHGPDRLQEYADHAIEGQYPNHTKKLRPDE